MDPVIASAIFVLGLAFGSFLNVCIYRLPQGLSVVTPRSACPQCKHPIALYDNIPVLSWLILGGRCRNCKEHISPRYLIIELLTGALFLACYWYLWPDAFDAEILHLRVPAAGPHLHRRRDQAAARQDDAYRTRSRLGLQPACSGQ